MGNSKKYNTNVLIEGFKKNDPKIMQQVYLNVFPKVRLLILKNNGNEDQAKDVFQDAFIDCWKNIKKNKLTEGSKIEAYLFTITKNKWIDYLRSSDFRKNKSIEDFSGLQIVEEDTDIDELKNESQRDIIQKALKQLGPNCKYLLQLFYYDRKPMDFISKQMGITVASARNQKYRCMQGLRSMCNKLMNDG